MRVIGIIGGLSWHSSAAYYSEINRLIGENVGGLHSPPLILVQTDFFDIERAQHHERWDEVAERVGALARQLECAGADHIVIACNTVHAVFSEIAGQVTTPILHIVDPVGRALASANKKVVGLVGSRWTMEGEYFRDRLFQRHGIATVLPNERLREKVHRSIYDELGRGILSETTRSLYRQIFSQMADSGAEAIILGCTEIMLLVNQGDAVIPLYDTTSLHIQEAVNLCTG
jgi:aspartate racemase